MNRNKIPFSECWNEFEGLANPLFNKVDNFLVKLSPYDNACNFRAVQVWPEVWFYRGPRTEIL